ncbi:MAG: RsmE family RNA methyltransferase, partial [Acidobacteriota bacterium]
APPPPAARPVVDLVLALPRPQMLQRILQNVATMQVARLDLVRSWRVEKSFFGSPALRPARIEQQLRLGLEQGGGTRRPRVLVHRQLRPCLDWLAARPNPPLRLIAHPGAPSIAAMAPALRAASAVQLAIGPEGGWIDREVASFVALGFRPVGLGPWILRVEPAVVAALAQIHALAHVDRPDRTPC